MNNLVDISNGTAYIFNSYDINILKRNTNTLRIYLKSTDELFNLNFLYLNQIVNLYTSDGTTLTGRIFSKDSYQKVFNDNVFQYYEIILELIITLSDAVDIKYLTFGDNPLRSGSLFKKAELSSCEIIGVHYVKDTNTFNFKIRGKLKHALILYPMIYKYIIKIKMNNIWSKRSIELTDMQNGIAECSLLYDSDFEIKIAAVFRDNNSYDSTLFTDTYKIIKDTVIKI